MESNRSLICIIELTDCFNRPYFLFYIILTRTAKHSRDLLTFIQLIALIKSLSLFNRNKSCEMTVGDSIVSIFTNFLMWDRLGLVIFIIKGERNNSFYHGKLYCHLCYFFVCFAPIFADTWSDVENIYSQDRKFIQSLALNELKEKAFFALKKLWLLFFQKFKNVGQTSFTKPFNSPIYLITFDCFYYWLTIRSIRLIEILISKELSLFKFVNINILILILILINILKY